MPLQCVIGTGTVICSKIERVTPPRNISRKWVWLYQPTTIGRSESGSRRQQYVRYAHLAAISDDLYPNAVPHEEYGDVGARLLAVAVRRRLSVDDSDPHGRRRLRNGIASVAARADSWLASGDPPTSLAAACREQRGRRYRRAIGPFAWNRRTLNDEIYLTSQFVVKRDGVIATRDGGRSIDFGRDTLLNQLGSDEQIRALL